MQLGGREGGRDAQDPKNSEAAMKLYTVCDLTKGVIEGKVCYGDSVTRDHQCFAPL